MSELVDDLKITTVEIITDLGLNFTSDNPRILHTGDGTLTVSSVGTIDFNGETINFNVGNINFIVDSSSITAINFVAPNGGFNLDVEKSMNFITDSLSVTAINFKANGGGFNLDVAQEMNFTTDSESVSAINFVATVGGFNLDVQKSIYIDTVDSTTGINIGTNF